MLPMHGGASHWMSRSHFVAQSDCPDDVVMKQFRDWLIFDCFVMMNSHGAAHYDDNRHVFEVIDNPDDDCNVRNAVDYSDVVAFLVGSHAGKPEGLPARSYADLYQAFLDLSPKTRSAIEWFVSQPPSPRRLDPLYGRYWGILHMTILIESIIGLPPYCNCAPATCECCKRTPPNHYSMSRKEWLIQELKRWTQSSDLAKKYASLITKGKEIRDAMSHSPHFDRSIYPVMNPGDKFSYDASQKIDHFKSDTVALEAVTITLQQIAHDLLVNEAFSIKHFREPPILKGAMVG